MAELVTGHAGTNHIDAGDYRALFRGVFGAKNFIIDENATLTLSGSSTVTIPKMDLLWLDSNGVGFCRLDGTDSVTIAGTSQGLYREDLICIKYTMADSVESIEVCVVQGTAGSTTTRPTITNTSTTKYLPLYEVSVYQSDTPTYTLLLDVVDRASLPISAGGTGVNSLSALKSMLGIPFGGISEFDLSESEGTIKFNCGLKLCLHRVNLTVSSNGHGEVMVNYPTAFTETPFVFVTRASAISSNIIVSGMALSKNQVMISGYNPNSAATTITVYALVIGKWC